MICVIGAGKFGTAIGVSFARNGHEVVLLSRKGMDYCDYFNKSDCLPEYEGIIRPKTLGVTWDTSVLEKASAIVLAVPTQQLPNVLDLSSEYLQNKPLLLLQKGILIDSHKLPFQLAGNYSSLPVSVLAGPNFADEIVFEQPSITSVVSSDLAMARYWAGLIDSTSLSVLVGQDVIGTQIAGAIKNVVAIVAGLSEGLNFGANTLAAVITRGMQEATNLGVAMGGAQETFLGPAGIGDFTLTCNSSKSRNYKFGKTLASGFVNEVLSETVEGAHTIFSIKALSEQYCVDMPVCSAVEALVQKKITPQDTMKSLMYHSACVFRK